MPRVARTTWRFLADLPVPQPSVLGYGTRITTITGPGWSLVNSPLCP
jgi:hypothetical protein